MPTRRAAPQKKARREASENSEGDNDLSLSQQSNSGEDQNEKFMEFIKKQYAANAEKERVRKEKKFMESSRKDLDVRTEVMQMTNDAVKDVERIYTKFLLDYAACEDEIQAIWAHIQERQESFIKKLEHRREKDQGVLSLDSVAVFPGIAKMKASRKAFDAIVSEHLASLLNEDIEGSEDSE